MNTGGEWMLSEVGEEFRGHFGAYPLEGVESGDDQDFALGRLPRVFQMESPDRTPIVGSADPFRRYAAGAGLDRQGGLVK